MEEKTGSPKPMVVLKHKDTKTKIFALDEGDSYPANTSTNYDHRYFGPSLVIKTEGHGHQSIEYYVNDFQAWEWIDQMMNLGMKYLEENPDFDQIKFKQEFAKRRENYKKETSHIKGE